MNKHLFLIICILVLNQLKSQDSQFNNVNHSLNYLNPSFAGSEECIRGQVDYRNQWPNLSGTSMPSFYSIDGYIKPIKGGVALNVINEDFQRGTLRRTGISIAYAQYFNLGSGVQLIPSVQFSANKSTLDRARLNFSDLIDPRYGIFWPPINSSTNDVPVANVEYTDMAAGIILKYVHAAEIGASFANLFEPNISHIGSYHLPVKTNLHANYKFPLDPCNQIDILIVSTFQNEYNHTRINLINKHCSGILIGLGYGINNSLWGSNGINKTKYHTLRGFLGYKRQRFSIMYSYDQYLLKSAAGSHELSLQVLFKKKASLKTSSIEDLK